jgi:hypothetical protein
MLRVLYHDEAGRQQLYRQLRENPKMQKALAYLDKAMLLAPKDLDLYRVAAQYHGEFRDLDQLKRVQQRMRAAALDMTASAKETLKSYRGDKDQENLTKVQTSIRKYQDLLKTPAVMSSAPTREYTAVTLNELEQTSAFYGGAQNSGKLLQEARAIYDARQSSYSSGGLIAAYGVLACDELGARDPQFASLAGLTKRSLSKYQLLLLVLERGGPLGERARQNQNVIKLLELEKQMIAQFPPFRDTMRWAAFHNVDPDIAAGVVQAYKSSELARDLEDLAFQLNPLQAATVLDYYWYLKLMGEEKKAIQIYQDAIQKGVPLPPLG